MTQKRVEITLCLNIFVSLLNTFPPMLSRRNIRIKVLQSLYAATLSNTTQPEVILQEYKETCQRTYTLLLFALQNFLKVASFAIKDEELRAGKLLANDEDRQFSGMLFSNPLTQSFVQNKTLQKECSRLDCDTLPDEDVLKKIYSEFAKEKEYQAYWQDHGDHLAILLSLLKYCVNNELFQEVMEDFAPSWVDDKSLILGTLKKVLKAAPTAEDFFMEYRPDADLIDEFGQNMLLAVWEKDAELTESIRPTLRNWDANRVATLDMLILKMAVCELLNFPTIPTKVTLNEFVEIAKQYSTDKSKEFINGVLDRLMKDFQTSGKIKKSGRGLVE